MQVLHGRGSSYAAAATIGLLSLAAATSAAAGTRREYTVAGQPDELASLGDGGIATEAQVTASSGNAVTPTAVAAASEAQTLAFVDHGRIEVVDMRSGAHRQIPRDPRFRRYQHVSWAPDHTQLAAIAVTRRGSIRQLALINTRTGAQTAIAGAAHAELPAWSPDGSKIAFAQLVARTTPDDEGPEYRLLVVRADGTGVHLVSGRARMIDAPPVWSPDSKYVEFVAADDGENLLFTVRARTGHPWLASRSPDWIPEYAGVAWLVGDRLLFKHFIGGVVGEEDTLESIDPDGGNRHVYKLNPSDFSFGVASPDGRYVPVYDSPDGPGLWLMAGDETMRRVKTGDAESIEGVTWSPDGKEFAFLRERPSRPVGCPTSEAGLGAPLDLFIAETASLKERRVLTLPATATCSRFDTDLSTFGGFTWGTPPEAQPGD